MRFIATYDCIKQNNGSLEEISKMVAQNAADRFNLPSKGRLAVGYDADVVVVNPGVETRFGKDMMVERCDTTLFEGKLFRGKVEHVFARGLQYGVDPLPVGRYRRQHE